jgi:hypothetical protein
MKPWTITLLAAGVVASGALAQHKEEYNLNAATADLASFHSLARDGVLRRQDVQADLNFGPRFGDADLDRDGVVTAAEMDRYIRQTYGIPSVTAGNEAVEAYRRHAATRDLEAFHQLARGGRLRLEDAQAHPVFGPRAYDADYNGDGVVTAQEMDRYVLQSYGIVASTSAGSRSASVGTGRQVNSGSASAGSSRPRSSGSAAAGSSATK